MKKKKVIALIGFLAVLLAFGLPRLHIQSVSDYQKEQKELAADLEMKPENPIEEFSKKEKTKKSTTENQDTQNSSKESQNHNTKKKNHSSAKKKQVSSKATHKETPKAAHKETPKPTHKETPKPTKTKDTSHSKKEEQTITCSLEITCHQLVKNKESAGESIEKYIPANGEILSKVTVKIKAGATAYDLLSTVCKASEVALDAEYTPVYGTYYVRGIGHIYEKQAGKRSGWIYKINGVSPNVGASDYKLSDGDICSWCFTCDGKSS